ncbi:MAG: hypothetical protein LBC93_00150 [Synergistaceae bacterium]|jgi:hypothetical protein|nr:hypothetical protein [Synergistaceae bacterium]
MNSSPKSLNDTAWEQLFSKYDILNQIAVNGQFKISARQIKDFREPRLMAKFDHTINLPKIFADNQLAILPIARGDYVISHFDAYYKFEADTAPILRVSLPKYIQSLDSTSIPSEAIALNCSVEDTTIEITDIQSVLDHVMIVQEPQIPFPQADSFARVINICELLNEQELSRNEVTERYAFDARQTNYYTDAARYLGLLKKRTSRATPIYELSDTGKHILRLNYKQRQLAFCSLILSHRAFGDTLRQCLEIGDMPLTLEIIQIMKKANLYNVSSNSTFERRSSTIKSWLNWILGLIND